MIGDRRIRRGGHQRGVRPSAAIRPAIRAGAYGPEHREPFDPMLAAQATMEGLALVSKDGAMREWGGGIVR